MSCASKSLKGGVNWNLASRRTSSRPCAVFWAAGVRLRSSWTVVGCCGRSDLRACGKSSVHEEEKKATSPSQVRVSECLCECDKCVRCRKLERGCCVYVSLPVCASKTAGIIPPEDRPFSGPSNNKKQIVHLNSRTSVLSLYYLFTLFIN